MSKVKLKHIIDQAEIKSWRLLMSAFQSVYSQLEKGLANEGISVSRFQVLFYLYFEQRMKASELSRMPPLAYPRSWLWPRPVA